MKALWKWMCWIAGAVIALFAFAFIREKKEDNEQTETERKRTEAEDAVRATPSHTVAERYEGVGDAVERGRARFAARVKKRVLATGGSGAGEQHTE